MYYYIKGIINIIQSEYIVLENNGIGYKLFVSHSEDYNLQDEVLIYVYQVIREDEHYLIGFSSLKEKEIFLKLIEVKGIGPKTAINALSKTRPNTLIDAIYTGNVSLLKSLPGIGAKAASQIILDLKGEILSQDSSNKNSRVSPKHQELKDALKALGYKMQDIDRVASKIDDSLTIEEMIKEALKSMRK